MSSEVAFRVTIPLPLPNDRHAEVATFRNDEDDAYSCKHSTEDCKLSKHLQFRILNALCVQADDERARLARSARRSSGLGKGYQRRDRKRYVGRFTGRYLILPFFVFLHPSPNNSKMPSWDKSAALVLLGRGAIISIKTVKKMIEIEGINARKREGMKLLLLGRGC